VTQPYRQKFTVRYLEVDQQGVVFNAWYLAYMDEALTGWFDHIGLPYAELLAAGCDAQLVHTELDWTGGLGFGDDASIEVYALSAGRTSFTVGFTIRRAEEALVRARTVYVCVATDGSGKREMPEKLRAAFTDLAGGNGRGLRQAR